MIPEFCKECKSPAYGSSPEECFAITYRRGCAVPINCNLSATDTIAISCDMKYGESKKCKTCIAAAKCRKWDELKERSQNGIPRGKSWVVTTLFKVVLRVKVLNRFFPV